MDLGSLLFSVCVMVICLLATARCFKGEEISCPCPGIPTVNLTEPPSRTCFQINDTSRYTCKAGYVRKAGTSNLIRCKQTNGAAWWTLPSLQCIPDPKRTTTQPPKTTVTKEISCPCPEIPPVNLTEPPSRTCFQINDTFRYTCKAGYVRKAGTSNLIRCKQINAAASTSLQMTQSAIISASVTAERQSAEPTSLGLPVLSDHTQGKVAFVRETKATDGPTSTSSTTEPSNNITVNPHVSNPELSITAGTTIVSLVIICALIGFSFFCYKRRSQNNTAQRTAEEEIPMNNVPSVPAS